MSERREVPWQISDFGWGLSAITDDEGKHYAFLELKTDSAMMGVFASVDVFGPMAEAFLKVFEDLKQREEQSKREAKVFDEKEARKRIPLDVAERIWASVNVEDDVANSLPVPADPAKPCHCGSLMMHDGVFTVRDKTNVVHTSYPSGTCYHDPPPPTENDEGVQPPTEA